jgi:hypothetical protein
VRTTDAKAEFFAIYEVYYDDDGRPEARTEEPVSPAGETREELEEDLAWYLRALQEPVLDDAVFPQAAVTPEEAERQQRFEALRQSNVRLAEAAELLRRTCVEIETARRERRESGGLFGEHCRRLCEDKAP